jgi:acyl carrier protein
LGLDDLYLDKDTRFGDLQVNSFGLIQLICAIEDEFDIEIPNSAIRSIKNVSDAVKVIRSQMKS